MRIGAALSRTRESDLAAVEAADAAAQGLGGEPCSLAVVFASPEHADHLADIGAAIETRLDPAVIVGAVAQGTVGPGVEAEEGPTVSVWCAAFDGGMALPVRTWSVQQPGGGLMVTGWPDTHPDNVTLLLADPFTYPATEVVGRIGRERTGHEIVGGLVTGGRGATRLLLGDHVYEDGAVGALLRDVDVDVVVSQGCRPVGEPLTVTRADQNVIEELAGEPAASRLQEMFAEADEDDRALMREGLHVGLVTDEYADEFSTGDFVIRGVLGADPETGGVAIGDLAEVGAVVQFQVRDAASADADLVERLAAHCADGHDAAGVLLFTCNGRGRRFFGRPDHDVTAIESALGAPVSGAFCAGEIGPVGDRSYVHGFTASLAVFRDGPDGP